MQTQSLLYGLIGFFMGGLLVAVAATVDSGPKPVTTRTSQHQTSSRLDSKNGDEFDEAFLNDMIGHHIGALDIAKLSATNAKHDEIKQLSKEIIAAQEKEITQMKQWQKDWGYTVSADHMRMSH